MYIQTSVRYDKMHENGFVKRTTDVYLVDALSFTEAEARTIEEVKPFISGEYTVSAAKKTKVAEIFWDESGDRWYQVRVAFITIDEKTGAEKRNVSVIMVQAQSFAHAYENFKAGMTGTMSDYEIVSIAETPILDVFKANTTESDD